MGWIIFLQTVGDVCFFSNYTSEIFRLGHLLFLSWYMLCITHKSIWHFYIMNSIIHCIVRISCIYYHFLRCIHDFFLCINDRDFHYDDVIMGAMTSQITSLTIVYSTVYSDVDQRKHQSSASLAFVWGFHRGPVNSPHKWPVMRKKFPFHVVIMDCSYFVRAYHWE